MTFNDFFSLNLYEVLADFSSWCEFEQIYSDILFGRSDESFKLMVNIILATCIFTGVSFLFYLSTSVLSCLFIKDIKKYGWIH